MKYAIYQIQLTDNQYDLINAKGHMSVPAHVAKMDMTMDFSGGKIGGLASDAWENGFYTHVSNIEAVDVNQVFEIGNIGPEENIERLSRMSSLSVSDVIVDEEGQIIVVAPVGFVAFSFNPKMAA
jgi:lipoate-protein ligase A|tara:strand:+ start:290 stop:664 length:375 start_codon:yes stop_codon:yes gene_type:complete